MSQKEISIAPRRSRTKKQTVQQGETFNEIEKLIKKQYEEDFQSMDYTKAVQYARMKQFLKYNKEQNSYEELPLNCDLKELAGFGQGIQLYFYFLKYFAWLFFILTVINTPNIYYNLTNDGLGTDSSAGTILKTTLANTPSRMTQQAYIEPLHNEIQEETNALGECVKACPRSYAPDKAKGVVQSQGPDYATDYKGDCWIPCDMYCWELEFSDYASPVVRYDQGTGTTKTMGTFKKGEQPTSKEESSSGTSDASKSGSSTSSSDTSKSDSSSSSSTDASKTGSSTTSSSDASKSGSRLLGDDGECGEAQFQCWRTTEVATTYAMQDVRVACGSQVLVYPSESECSWSSSSVWCEQDQVCYQHQKTACTKTEQLHPSKGTCINNTDSDFAFAKAMNDYNYVCPSQKAAYIAANPVQSDWPGNYSDYSDDAPPLMGDVSADSQKEMASEMTWYAAYDLVSLAVFAIFSIIYRRKSKQLIEIQEADDVTVSDYSIYVEGFPGDDPDMGNKLKQHFNQFGKVLEEVMVKDYQGTLYKFQKLAKLKLDMLIEKELIKRGSGSPKKYESLLKKVNKYKQELKNLEFFQQDIKSMADLKNIGAFLIFNRYQDVEELRHIYEGFEKKKCLCCTKRVIPQKHLLEGKYHLKINFDNDDPSNIQWENMDITPSEASWRQIAVKCFIFLLMLVTVVILIEDKSLSQTPSGLCSYLSFNRADLGSITKGKQTLKTCFCDYMELLESEGKYDSTDDNELNTFCDIYGEQSTTATIIGYLASICIVVINVCAGLIVIALSKFARFKNLSQKMSILMNSQFFLMVVNTCLITLCVTFRFTQDTWFYNFDVTPIYIVNYLGIGSVPEDSDAYSNDVDRPWYTNFASPILSALLYCWLNPLIAVAIDYVKEKQVNAKVQNCQLHIQAKRMLTKPPFPITKKYATAFMYLYLCWIFGCGMPIFYFIGFGLFTLNYYADRYILLRKSSRSNKIDSTLNNRIISSLTYMLMIHCAFSLFMLTSHDLFDPYDISNNDGMDDRRNANLVDNDRFRNDNMQFSFFHMMALFFYSLFFIFDEIILRIYQKLKQFFGQVEKHEKQFGENQGTFQEELQKIEVDGLSSYNLIKNEQYKDTYLAYSAFIKEIQTMKADDTQQELTPSGFKAKKSPRGMKLQPIVKTDKGNKVNKL